MSELEMPTTEAEVGAGAEDDRARYELAFHILPTVVEGEVPTIFEAIKAMLAKAGGEIIDEETPQRFDLAYEIVKHIEGKNRNFGSAYFGWVRFKAEPSAAEAVTAEMSGNQKILRHLLIRLTKEEEMSPFRFHESLADQKQVHSIEETDIAPVETGEDTETTDTVKVKEDDKVSDEDLEDVLKKSAA